MTLFGKNIFILFIIMGALLQASASDYYSIFTQNTYLMTKHRHCEQKEDGEKNHCKEAQHKQNNCVLPCTVTLIFIQTSNLEMLLSPIKYRSKKKQIAFYENFISQSAYFLNWVPPQIV